MLGVLVRRGWRWHLGKEIQLVAVLALEVDGLLRPSNITLLSVNWTLFAVVGLVSPAFIRLDEKRVAEGRLRKATRLFRWARWTTGGRAGRFYELYGRYLQWCAEGQVTVAETMFDEVLEMDPPPSVRREFMVSKMYGFLLARQWNRVLDAFELHPTFGTHFLGDRARLIALRAYAETGRIDNALLCLASVVRSPLVCEFQIPIAMGKAALFALAGDLPRLQTLFENEASLLRKLPPFTRSYWLCRCHLARGEFHEAANEFRNALDRAAPAMEPQRKLIEARLADAENRRPRPVTPPPHYDRALEEIARREKQSLRFGKLVGRGRPGAATTGVFAALVLISVAFWYWPAIAPNDWVHRFGNLAQSVREGQWWRLFTSMGLHADWLHLAMNSLGLLILGRAVERYWGAWRFLAIFIAAGALGNLASNVFWPDREIAIGASGGVNGLLGALLVAFADARAFHLRRMRNKICIFLVAIIILQTIVDFHEPQLDKVAHLAGVVSGALVAWILKPRKEPDD